MSDYVITTDSNSDVLPEFIEENHLTVIPQYYAFGDTVYGDELNMAPHEFYETMRNGELPKSMANNPAVIRERFEQILKEGKNILFFASTFSSKMQIDFLKVAWGISPVLHFLCRHSFGCRREAVAGIQSFLVTDM